MARLLDDASSQWLSGTPTANVTNPWSLSVWCYLDASVSAFAMGFTDGSDIHGLGIFESGGTLTPVIGYARATWSSATGATSTVSLNTWFNLVGVYDNTPNRTVYLNGGNKGSAAGSSITGTEYRCGAAENRGNPAMEWSGRLALIAYWNTALTDSDALALGSGIHPRLIKPSSLVAIWPFGYPAPNHDNDVWSSEDLTPQNSPTWANSPSGLIVPGQSTYARRLRVVRPKIGGGLACGRGRIGSLVG